MAFNLRSFGVRTLSAFFFVVLLLGSLTWNYISFSLFFLVIAIGGLHEFYNIMDHMGLQPFRRLGYLCGLALYVIFLNFRVFTDSPVSDNHLYFAVVLPLLISGASVFSRRPNAVTASIYSTAGLLYCVLPFALMHKLVFDHDSAPAAYEPGTLLGVILLIWCNDTFAYLGGNLFGRHKMIERISPGKTWEGTITGIAVSFAMSFLIRDLVAVDHRPVWPVLGIVVPVLATTGDLVQSMLKRKAGVKDSGSIMPGHGGILDRFDSLIFVVPFVFVLQGLLQLN